MNDQRTIFDIRKEQLKQIELEAEEEREPEDQDDFRLCKLNRDGWYDNSQDSSENE